jgi:hypothetical protein
LYYAHLYLMADEASFQAWAQHQTDIQHMDDNRGPDDSEDHLEVPHRPAQTSEAYSKAQLLEYWLLCDEMVDEAVDAMDLTEPDCGFSWYTMGKAEHQVVAIRHIQHHAAQLGARVRAMSAEGIDWVGGGRG